MSKRGGDSKILPFTTASEQKRWSAELPPEDRMIGLPVTVRTYRSGLIEIWEELERRCRDLGIPTDVVLWRALVALAEKGSGAGSE